MLVDTHRKDLEQPELPKYKHTTRNLLTHKQRFRSLLMLQGNNNSFSASYSQARWKMKLKWFNDLKPKLITLWAELYGAFMERFNYNYTLSK